MPGLVYISETNKTNHLTQRDAIDPCENPQGKGTRYDSSLMAKAKRLIYDELANAPSYILQLKTDAMITFRKY